MSMTGYLSAFTLPELFQLMAEGNKSGLLTVGDSKIAYLPNCHKHHIWFNQGEIVAAAGSLDNRGLISLLEQRGWLNSRAAALIPTMSNCSAPLGLSLKSENLLQAEQLKLLFQVQVMQPIAELFTWKTGWFDFKQQTTLPTTEMTGLSRSATEVLLIGLRSLQDWSALAEKLPEPNSGLISLIQGKPQFQLNLAEARVWEFTHDQVAIKDMAKRLNSSVERVQQIAFQFILAGLAEETTMVESSVSVVGNECDRSPNFLPKSFSHSVAVDLGIQQPVAPVNQSLPKNPSPVLNQPTLSNNIVDRRTEAVALPSAPQPTPAPSQNYFQNLVAFLRNKGDSRNS